MPSTPSRRILVVDDDINTLDALVLFLEQRLPRVRVVSAENASIALERMKVASVDLVITDYDMPEMNGLELLQEVRDHDVGIAAILITGKGDVEIAARAVNEQHVDYFFTKPLDHERLAVAVGEALWERDRGKIRDEILRQAAEMARAAADRN